MSKFKIWLFYIFIQLFDDSKRGKKVVLYTLNSDIYNLMNLVLDDK